MRVFTVARVAVEAMLDAVVPMRARAARTRSRTAQDIPLSPTVHDLLGVHITTLMDYRQEAAQDLVRSLKYDASVHAANLAAQLLADYLREELAAARAFSPRRILLVPVPLHRNRARERGFNQIEVVLQALPQEFRDGTLSAYAPEILVRTRATKQQTRLPRSERLSNVAGAFALAERTDVKKSRVYLFDDVTTTGATLVNAAHPLRRAGADVTLIALARS
jgi:ComF family protein